MPNEPSDENATPPPEPPKDAELSDQQLETVSGGTGRSIQDCEGFAVLSGNVGTTTSPTLKSE
jgi:hypothetical protein